MNATSEELVDRVGAVVARVRDLEKDIEKLRGAAVVAGAGDLVSTGDG